MLTVAGERLGSVQESPTRASDEEEGSEGNVDEEQDHEREGARAQGQHGAVDEDESEDSKEEDDEDDDSEEYETDSGSGSEYETDSDDDEAGEQKSALQVSPGGTVGSKAVQSALYPILLVFHRLASAKNGR